VVLRRTRHPVGIKVLKYLTRDLRVQRIQYFEAISDILVISKFKACLSDYVSGIHALIHKMSSKPKPGLTIQNSPVDRGATSILRKKAGMQIDGAERSQREHSGWEQIPVVCDP
jgi:hypothetical protein